MQKISFDAEDFPPPSYYYGNEADEDVHMSGSKTKETATPLFQDHSASDGGGQQRKSPLNVQVADVAPVHQSAKAVGAEAKEADKGSALDKSEWWKAPEFIPRNLTGQLPSNGCFLTQQQQQPGSVSQHGANFASGSSKDLSQIPFQQALATPPQQHPPATLASKTTPVIHPTLTPPVPAPFPIPMPPTGLGPTPTPAFIPLPLPTPPASAAAGWPIGATPGSAAAPSFNHALAALHSQLARVYAHNPRVMRGQHPAMPVATAYHNQKLQQLILQQQQQHQQQQQNQFQQRHTHHRQIMPFAPTNVAPLRAAPAGPGPGIPTGYTANMTTIDAGLGRPIPAIVLKRKRKKKSKKVVDAKQQQQPKQSADAKEQSSDQQQQSSQSPELTSSRMEAKSEDVSGQRSEEEEDDETTSSLTSPHLAETRRSEPDLTKMQHESSQTVSAVCDVLIGTAGEHLVQQSCYYPNDLDLIQSANHCVMITGSCPDLSAEMDLTQQGCSNNAIMSMSNHINPFLREDRGSEMDECQNQKPEQLESKGQFFIAKVGDSSMSRSAYGVDEFELDTNPVVRDAMRDLVSDGMIKSKQVKELNRQVIKDMRLEEKVRHWRDEDWSEPELDEDDTIFDRLLKNEDARQHTAKKQLETNPGKGQKSLKEELEEGLMAFRNRGAREYGRVPLNDEDASENRPLVHHTAIVHGSKRDGEMAKTELLDSDEGGNAGSKKQSKHSSLIPRATYVESEMEDDERMRITVNALDALDVDGADTFLAKSHLRSAAAGVNHVQSLDDVSANTASKRRYSFSEAVPLVPLVRSRNCCALM